MIFMEKNVDLMATATKPNCLSTLDEVPQVCCVQQVIWNQYETVNSNDTLQLREWSATSSGNGTFAHFEKGVNELQGASVQRLSSFGRHRNPVSGRLSDSTESYFRPILPRP